MAARITVEGANVLVTGASSGIGAATARLLAERGATVGLVARRADRLEEVLEDCRRSAPGSRMWAVDLGDTQVAAGLVQEAWRAFGHLDVLVNNAAMPKRRHVTLLTMAEVEETMRVNFLSPVAMTLAALPLMTERGRGVIVNVSSLGGRLGIAREAAYCASKFALVGWSEGMYIDLDGAEVAVRLVNPGAYETDIWDRPGSDAPVFDVPKGDPTECAAGIVAAIEGDRFEHYVPDMGPIVEAKTADVEGFLTGVARAAGQA